MRWQDRPRHRPPPPPPPLPLPRIRESRKLFLVFFILIRSKDTLLIRLPMAASTPLLPQDMLLLLPLVLLLRKKKRQMSIILLFMLVLFSYGTGPVPGAGAVARPPAPSQYASQDAERARLQYDAKLRAMEADMKARRFFLSFVCLNLSHSFAGAEGAERPRGATAGAGERASAHDGRRKSATRARASRTGVSAKTVIAATRNSRRASQRKG